MARGINEKNPHNSSNYVQTRWYRAPEMILDSDNVTNAIDIWSVGCVFAELLQRQVLFAGENPAQQLEYILSVTGTPKKKVGSLEGQIYLEKLPVTEGQDLHVLFLGCNVQAIDLLSKMIQFHPDDRIGAFEALRHPYFSSR
jgi:serine/threonine protein kinase